MHTGKIQETIRAETQLPTRPNGFMWKLYGDATFLKPIAWRERERVATTGAIFVNTYTTSPEHLCEEREFDIGMTAQVFRDTRKILGIEAKQMARGYLNNYLAARKQEEVLQLERYIKGGCESTFFRFTYTPPVRKSGIVHKFILANNITDSVHIFTFESPTKVWNENWTRYGTPIFGQLVSDSATRGPFYPQQRPLT